MDNFLNFFINIGKLKDKKRRGWLTHQIDNCETTASHTFRLAVLAWMFGKRKRFNTEKMIKMALAHDLCEVFAKDETPYDPLLPANFNSLQDKKKTEMILSKWPKFSLVQKQKKSELKHKRECAALKKLTAKLPLHWGKEIMDLWNDFEFGLSREGRFMKQLDKAENFLQGMEYWKKYGRIKKDLWVRWIKEIFDDPVLLEFEKSIEKKLIKK
ncbi:MAG: HD domain-containing protein [Patescibacteria group bacterium]|nr:HD domain-containing protein [Patescibacteria group bacterium]